VRVTAEIDEAAADLDHLIEHARAGDEVVIEIGGRPAARLLPVDAPRRPRKSGRLRGQVGVADDFDDTPDWLIDAFES
jgi:prevent-host-death family protein